VWVAGQVNPQLRLALDLGISGLRAHRLEDWLRQTRLSFPRVCAFNHGQVDEHLPRKGLLTGTGADGGALCPATGAICAEAV
jgi:hypothetical protein